MNGRRASATLEAPRRLVGPAYLLGLVLVAFPLLEAALSVFPPSFGEVTWRFGAAGVLSRALMTPLLGDVVLVATSAFAGHRRILWTLGVLNFVAGAAALIVLLLLTLDALQMRSLTRPEALASFDAASVVAALKFFVAVVVTVWIGTAAAKP